MKVCFLRVGIDRGYYSGGILGPLFESGTPAFEFIPIREWHSINQTGCPKYKDLLGRRDGQPPLSSYFSALRGLSDRQRQNRENMPAHNDPEFVSNTYGHLGIGNHSISELEENDLLVFYAGLEPYAFEDENLAGTYIIGYFEVEKADYALNLDNAQIHRDFTRNQHVRWRNFVAERSSLEKPLFLVKGRRVTSRLLERGELIGKEVIVKGTKRCQPTEEFTSKAHTDYRDLTMAVPHWVRDNKTATDVKRWVLGLE